MSIKDFHIRKTRYRKRSQRRRRACRPPHTAPTWRRSLETTLWSCVVGPSSPGSSGRSRDAPHTSSRSSCTHCARRKRTQQCPCNNPVTLFAFVKLKRNLTLNYLTELESLLALDTATSDTKLAKNDLLGRKLFLVKRWMTTANYFC